MNLAIISPSQNKFSETFIQAHKKIAADKVFYYYGGLIPNYVEGQGLFNLTSESLNIKGILGLALRFNPISKIIHKFSIKEQLFASSLKKNKIDVVLAEFGQTAVACMNVCDKLNIPLISHFHGYDITAALKENYENYKLLVEKSAFVVGVSKDMVNTLRKLGANEDKIIYTPCGPNPDFLKTNPSRFSKKFLSVGRFVDKKAPYYTILAFMKAIEKHPDAQLYMVGTGPLFNTCRNLINYLKLDKNIHLLGVKTPQQIKELHNECCAFIQHSIKADDGDTEGTPVGVMEASLSSLPVVATRHAGIKDVIIDNETGLLCDEHDVDSMARNICYIIDNPENSKIMGEKGREYIMKNFSLQSHINILSEAVHKAYANRHRGG